MKNVLIFGSCVSRDAFSFIGSDDISITGYFARSSVASFTSKPERDQKVLDVLKSPFQRRVIEADMDKSFLSFLGKSDFDTLLVDFIDERFSMLQKKSGALHTLCTEYVAAINKIYDGRRIAFDSAEKVRLWEEGWKLFFDTLAERGYEGKILVSRLFWATECLDGSAFEEYSPADIERVNAHMRTLYEIVERVTPSVRFIEYSAGELRADPAHRWGIAPFHFGESLYRKTLEALRAP